MITLRIGGVDEAFNIPWKRVCENRAFSQQYSLQLSWRNFDGGTGHLMRAINSGELDMAVVLTEGAVLDIIKNQKACIISFYVLSELEWGIHVSKYGNVKTINDIPGNTIAISRFGSGSHLMPMLMAQENGWPQTSLSFHESLNLTGGIRDLMKNTAQVFFWEKHTTAPFLHTNSLLRIGSYLSKWPAFSLVCAKNNSAAVTKHLSLILAEVIREATVFKSNPQSLSDISARYQMSDELASSWMNATRWITQPGVDERQLNYVVESLHQCGLIHQSPPVSTLLCL